MYNYGHHFILQYRLLTLQHLIQHLNQEHIKLEQMEFKSFQEFMQWKSEEEVCTDSSYVQQCSAQTRANTCIWCNQSGVYQSKGLRKHALKLQGSCKLGEFCTAHITASQNKSGGNVTVKYCPTHHNHEPRNDISHLQLPENER